MTRAEIFKAVRNLANELSPDAGALLDEEENLASFVDDAAELVTIDLVEYMPEDFLASENISLVANTGGYSLNTEWIQIWTVNRNVSGQSPTPIDYVDIQDILNFTYVGETAEQPDAWYLKGSQINFVPTPSANSANYATAWVVASEAAEVPENGPIYIPRLAHRCIVYMACALIAIAIEADQTRFERLYAYRMKKLHDSLGPKVQSQPRFLKPSVLDRKYITTRDKALYDIDPFFGR